MRWAIRRCLSFELRKKIYDESHVGVVAAGVGAVAGGILFGPELLAACGVNLAACTELGITAAELPFGAATAGGAALGVGGFGSLGAKAIDDSASYAKWWDDLAQPKNLTDREARAWYLSKEAEIPARINSSASLEEQAKQAFDMRNDLRSTARELMSNRTLADSLSKTDPNRTWSEIVNKYSSQGLSGDELWSKIIEKSQSSRSSVNNGLGM